MMFWIIFILLNLLVDKCNNYKILSLSFVTSDLLGLFFGQIGQELLMQ